MTLILKADTEVPRDLNFEELLLFLQKRTHLLMYINEGVIGWWKSLDEVPNGGYEIDDTYSSDEYYVINSKEINHSYGYKDSFTVISSEVVCRMCG